MTKTDTSHVVPVVPPRSAVNQLMGLYVIVAFMLALSWFLGNFSFSFLWVFGIIFGLFVVWKTRLREIVERNLDWHKEHYHRKRALRQEETAEWLNFIVNRWWVFSSVSIEDLVKRRINDRLFNVKPAFVGNLELTGFTFGDITPSIRCIKAFECSPDGVRGFKPLSWSSVVQPPAGLDRMSTFQIVLEADMASRCEDFRMIFLARVGAEKVGLNFDVAVEDLSIKGTLQVVLHMSMDVAFPHITKATISFTELPEVWFNVTVLKALQLMEIPMIKSWIHINVMEGITKALVDPGKIDIPFATAGPVNSQQFTHHGKSQLAQGVLTICVKGLPSVHAGDDVQYTRLRVGKSKRQTSEVLASQSWEDYCSFFVHDLPTEKLSIKHKCKRLLTTVTLQQHDLELSSFPFNLTKQINHTVDNNDGSKLILSMDYSPLSPINFLEEEPVNVLQRAGVLYVCVHCANNVIASDKTGSSDPYCVVFCDRRRVLTTTYVAQTRNPSWESQTEFFVRDFTQCQLSFYIFDWDGSNNIDDDFLGSALYAMSEKEPCVLNHALTLGYNKQGAGHVSDPSLGQIFISIVFRPVPSVEKSERYRLSSTDTMNNNNHEFMYVEDLVSPGTLVIDVQQKIRKKKSQGHRRLSKAQSTGQDDFMKGKVFVDLTIVQAKELRPMDRNGYSDPFCEVRIGETKLFSTSVKKKTLSPQWNESVTLQVTEECGMLEIQMFDKDIMFNDFLGKISLTLDQLKEISLKGTADWFTLQHTKSGQIQVKCTVTAPDSPRRDTVRSENINQSNDVAGSPMDMSKTLPLRESSIESDVFITPENNQVTKMTPPLKEEEETMKEEKTNHVHSNIPTSTPLKDSPAITSLQESPVPTSMRRSASDVNMDRRISRNNSLNSFTAFQDLDVNSDTHEVDNGDTNENQDEITDGHSDRMYSITGKVLSVQGLKFNEGTIYCKVRVILPHKHRIRQIFGSRVIAKSALVRASQPIINLPIDLDRGMGLSRDTLLKFDIKREGKEHLASKAFTLKSLFSGPGGEADKIQKVLPLENNLQVELYLQHSPPDNNTFLRRRTGSRLSNMSRSFRKSAV
ncbi:hypothetical protein ACF0H5_002170 [Mactra antiquata]